MITDPYNIAVSDWLEERLNIDGPHSDEQTRDAAEALAYLVRWLNHATRPGRAQTTLEYPSSIDALIGYLHAAVASLPQLLGQVARKTEVFATDGRLLADNLGEPADPAVLARVVASELRLAGRNLQAVTESLQEARRASSRLAIRTEEDA